MRLGIAAALALIIAGPALGQTAPTAADRLLQPAVDGDPRHPPTFRKRLNDKDRKDKTSRISVTPSRFDGLPIFGPLPAAGAGTTGYDSLNRPRSKTRAGAASRRNSSRSRVTGTQPEVSVDTFGRPTTRTTADRAQRARDQRNTAPAKTTSTTTQPLTTQRRKLPPAASRPGAYGYALATGAATTSTAATVTAGTTFGTVTTTGTTTTTTGVNAALRRRPQSEDDPFAPIGTRAGSFLIKPAVELSGGYDSNPARAVAHTGSTIYIVAPELQAQSQWSRHELIANIKGSYTGYGQTTELNRPNFEAKINGRIDVRRDTRIELEGRGTVATESPGSDNLQTGAAKLPFIYTYGATAGLVQSFNRFALSAKSTLDRALYADTTLNNGTIDSNKDRDYIQYGGTLRGSYELTPGVKPFVEVGADARVHDLTFDSSGLQRDSTGRSVKLGSTFELTRKLTGEISAGFLKRHYKDPTLADLSGFIADASLVWNASALTTVKLTAKSSANESTLAGVSGVLTRDVGLEVDHAFRRWLVGALKLGYGLDLYDGIGREETRYLAAAALTYKLSRALWFKGELRRDWLYSSEPNSNYAASTVLFGLRLQR